MNLQASNPSSSARDSTPTKPQASAEECATFERLLAAKLAPFSQDEAATTQSDAGACEPFAGFGLGCAPALVVAHVSEAITTGARGLQEGSFNTARAAQEIIAAPLVTEAPASFEVTMRERLGVALEMRATRTEAQPGWSLTIGSPVVDAAVLQRHVPRLNEQLRARAVEFTHVRIEGDDDDSERDA